MHELAIDLNVLITLMECMIPIYEDNGLFIDNMLIKHENTLLLMQIKA